MNEQKIMLDINPEHGVQISIREDSKQIWVNVDGLCRMRLTAMPKKSFSLSIEDQRLRAYKLMQNCDKCGTDIYTPHPNTDGTVNES